jgi:hypothetical protein
VALLKTDFNVVGVLLFNNTGQVVADGLNVHGKLLRKTTISSVLND